MIFVVNFLLTNARTLFEILDNDSLKYESYGMDRDETIQKLRLEIERKDQIISEKDSVRCKYFHIQPIF